MSEWYAISKEGTDFKANYPISVIHNNLKSKFLPYRQAYKVDFTGSNVVLHCVWKKNQYDEWKNIFPVVTKAKNLWLEFDADSQMDSLYQLDEPKDTARFFYKVFESANKFIWEQPMYYNPFVRDVERINLRFYSKRFERPVNPVRDIDFFTVIDTHNNVSETLELFTRYNRERYKVCVMLLNRNLYDFYKNKLDYPIITNERKFSISSVRRYEGLMARSKVYIDLSYRLTTGRVVYDALYNGAYFVGSNYYGATNNLFPEYGIETYPVDLADIFYRSIEANKGWSANAILNKRKEVLKQAGIGGFIKELRERSI